MLTGTAIGFILWVLLLMWNFVEAYTRNTNVDDMTALAVLMLLVSAGATVGYILEVM